MADDGSKVVADEDNHIDVTVGVADWLAPNGMHVLEEDYAIDGEIWRVHKNDPDPFPSRPHAHCVGGRSRFIGCKLHLGTGELYRKTDRLGKRLNPKQFERLIELIRPKFPGITLPIP